MFVYGEGLEDLEGPATGGEVVTSWVASAAFVYLRRGLLGSGVGVGLDGTAVLAFFFDFGSAGA